MLDTVLPMITIEPAHLYDQGQWACETFGPGPRAGVFRHLEKEVAEAEKNPEDVSEWADLLILTFDGAMRNGHEPEDILRAYHAKMIVNREREWPDWRGQPTDVAIEHVR